MMTTHTTAYTSLDLDKEETYQSTLSQIASIDSNNFAVYFDHEQATAATNLEYASLVDWTKNHESKLGTKWIHFWADASQRSIIEAIASTYDISPRLVGLLCPPPASLAEPPTPLSTVSDGISKCQTSKVSTKSKAIIDDRSRSSSILELTALTTGRSDSKHITFGDVVNDLWHFHSVDWGEKYVHVGVNVLSIVPGLTHSVDKPAGQRSWISLVLCYDGTVISTVQRQTPSHDVKIAAVTNQVTKRHVLNILSQVSRLSSQSAERGSDLMGIAVRPNTRVTDLSPELAYKERTETASLLFYYLFDDWMSTFALITRREHPYRESLENVRQELIESPNVHVLEDLYNIGRQLTTLKLMYQSYAAVVTRILTKYHQTTSATAFYQSRGDVSHMQTWNEAEHSPTKLRSLLEPMIAPRPTVSPHHSSGDLLSFAKNTSYPTVAPAALSRFERLLDRIHLYALSEINQALAEKEALSLMTFNLLTLSESRTIERLTRTATLLAKATILFLPVSLLTAYFGIQFVSAQYNQKIFWLSFLVVSIFSIVFLVSFEYATRRMTTLRKILWRKWVNEVAKRKKSQV